MKNLPALQKRGDLVTIIVNGAIYYEIKSEKPRN